MSRAIWKGAISFGLVHIPVALHSATSSQSIDFDWLDERSMEPVGYKRVNKVTGKEVTKEHIVKGVAYEKGRYVVLSEEEIRQAHPASTQTIDIFSFIDSEEIPLANIDTPYYLSPDKRGEKVYALLRETLIDSRKVALAYVILHTRQHLAALMPIHSALVLVLLRWPAEVRGLDELALTKNTTDAALTKSEKEMAKRLVSDMAGEWEPDNYRDTFQEKIMQLVEKKARDGEIENVETEPGAEERKSADIIDLTELLKRSLRGKGAGSKTHKADTEVSKIGKSTKSSSATSAKSKSSTTKSASSTVKKSTVEPKKKAPAAGKKSEPATKKAKSSAR